MLKLYLLYSFLKLNGRAVFQFVLFLAQICQLKKLLLRRTY